jgi:hypothetical protein
MAYEREVAGRGRRYRKVRAGRRKVKVVGPSIPPAEPAELMCGRVSSLVDRLRIRRRI